MSAYCIVYRGTPVRDEAAIAEYSRRNCANAAAAAQSTGVQLLVVYGGLEALEGNAPVGMVVLRLPTVEQARAWNECPEYQEAIPFFRSRSPNGTKSSPSLTRFIDPCHSPILPAKAPR